MIVVDVANSLLEVWTLRTFVDGQVEELGVTLQRKLVHRIDLSQVGENKEEDRCSFGAGSISLENREAR